MIYATYGGMQKEPDVNDQATTVHNTNTLGLYLVDPSYTGFLIL